VNVIIEVCDLENSLIDSWEIGCKKIISFILNHKISLVDGVYGKEI